jgi:GT2 family glycosyltransferase
LPTLAALIGSYDDEPAAQNFFSQYKNLLHHYVHQTSSEEASTFWGACGAIRREVFLALGGFDDKQYPRPSIEDIEFGYRLKRAGYRIRLVKGLQVKHLKRWDAFSLIKTDFFQRALPWTELILRDRHLVNDLNLQTSSRISVALTFALIGILPFARRWAFLRGMSALLAGGLLALNAPLYHFFWRKRTLFFTLQAIMCHWFYYFYSGLAFSIVFARHRRRGQPQGIAPTARNDDQCQS